MLLYMMPNASVSTRLFSLLLTGLMLCVSVWSKQVVAKPQAEKAKTEQSDTPQDAHHSSVGELSPMATASVVVLDFQPHYEFLAPASWAFVLRSVPRLVAATPPFLLSYFQNLFGNYIATNAP